MPKESETGNFPAPKLVRWTEPAPMNTGSPRPALYLADGGALHCAYNVRSDMLPERTAVLRFEHVLFFKFGWPNEEVIEAHELYPYGLKWYGFYVVEHSPLIREIAERNSVHPNHKRSHFDSFYHHVITFHDETLEVIAGKSDSSGRRRTSRRQGSYRQLSLKRSAISRIVEARRRPARRWPALIQAESGARGVAGGDASASLAQAHPSSRPGRR